MRLPQRCVSPRCKADLSDPAVPAGIDAALFSLVRSGKALDDQGREVEVWQCPICSHVWLK